MSATLGGVVLTAPWNFSALGMAMRWTATATATLAGVVLTAPCMCKATTVTAQEREAALQQVVTGSHRQDHALGLKPLLKSLA